jgi:hypothetical protein
MGHFIATERSGHPLKNIHGHGANFSITGPVSESRYRQRQRFLDVHVTHKEELLSLSRYR